MTSSSHLQEYSDTALSNLEDVGMRMEEFLLKNPDLGLSTEEIIYPSLKKSCEMFSSLKSDKEKLARLGHHVQTHIAELIDGSLDPTELWKEYMTVEKNKDLDRDVQDKYDKILHNIWEIRKVGEEPGKKGKKRRVEEDDFEITEESISLKCPLSQMLMDTVYTSKLCKHSFSSAIIQALKRKKNIECPVAGCNRYVSMDHLEKDKRLQRLVDKERHRLEDGDSDDDDVDVVID